MNPSRKFGVVTTFNQSGLDKYAQRMIDTYCNAWPIEVPLFVYAENCQPRIPDRGQVCLRDLDAVAPLMRFKHKWANDARANGDIRSDPVRGRRRDAHKTFKWNAVRFAHKVYSIFDCAKTSNSDVLIWMDADMVCHSPITVHDLDRLCAANFDLCYLGRPGKYSECGLYAMDLGSPRTRNFLDRFQHMYDWAEQGIFQLDEWHDSFVFDHVRRSVDLRELNWSETLGDLRPTPGNSPGEGHPLINSAWGAYLDHLKGSRKERGSSNQLDIKVTRNEAYWRHAPAS